jgi:hypothetical protein
LMDLSPEAERPTAPAPTTRWCLSLGADRSIALNERHGPKSIPHFATCGVVPVSQCKLKETTPVGWAERATPAIIAG